MKRISAAILLTLMLLIIPLSLTSCQSEDEMAGAKVTQLTLEFNYYEVWSVQGDGLLEYGTTKKDVSSFITGYKHESGDRVVFVYCKNEKAADEAYVKLSVNAAE